MLVIEPDPTATAQLDLALKRMGVEAWFAPDAEAGWRTFARERPTVVLTAFDTPRNGGAWFLRRLQTEYMGTMQIATIDTAHGLVKARVGADQRLGTGETVGMSFISDPK